MMNVHTCEAGVTLYPVVLNLCMLIIMLNLIWRHKYIHTLHIKQLIKFHVQSLLRMQWLLSQAISPSLLHPKDHYCVYKTPKLAHTMSR